MAAFELKKRGWEFNYRFQTWTKKQRTKETSQNGRQVFEKIKTYYFDFEHEFKIKASSSNDIQVEDPKFQQYTETQLNPVRTADDEERGRI